MIPKETVSLTILREEIIILGADKLLLRKFLGASFAKRNVKRNLNIFSIRSG